MKLTTTKTHMIELDHEEFLVIRNILVKAENNLPIDDYEQVVVHDFIDTVTLQGF